MPGRGAEGLVNGRDVKVVSPGYLREQGIEVEDAQDRTPFGAGQDRRLRPC